MLLVVLLVASAGTGAALTVVALPSIPISLYTASATDSQINVTGLSTSFDVTNGDAVDVSVNLKRGGSSNTGLTADVTVAASGENGATLDSQTQTTASLLGGDTQTLTFSLTHPDMVSNFSSLDITVQDN